MIGLNAWRTRCQTSNSTSWSLPPVRLTQNLSSWITSDYSFSSKVCLFQDMSQEGPSLLKRKTYLPSFVIIISVWCSLNFSHSSLFCRSTVITPAADRKETLANGSGTIFNGSKSMKHPIKHQMNACAARCEITCSARSAEHLKSLHFTACSPKQFRGATYSWQHRKNQSHFKVSVTQNIFRPALSITENRHSVSCLQFWLLFIEIESEFCFGHSPLKVDHSYWTPYGFCHMVFVSSVTIQKYSCHTRARRLWKGVMRYLKQQTAKYLFRCWSLARRLNYKFSRHVKSTSRTFVYFTCVMRFQSLNKREMTDI